MTSKKKQLVRTQAHAIAVATAGKLASSTLLRPSLQNQKNVLRIIDGIFNMLEGEFSEVSLVDLTRALDCVFHGKVDSSEANILRVFDRTFELIGMEFSEFETEVQVRAVGSVLCGLMVCPSYVDGPAELANLRSDCRPIRGIL
jgi:hypothetical protein